MSHRRWSMVTVAVTTTVLVVFSVTAQTGLPLPGPMHRASRSDLDRLAERINRAPIPWNCSGEPPRVHVDLLRGRVVVDQAGATELVLTADERAMLDGGPFYPLVCGGPS